MLGPCLQARSLPSTDLTLAPTCAFTQPQKLRSSCSELTGQRLYCVLQASTGPGPREGTEGQPRESRVGRPAGGWTRHGGPQMRLCSMPTRAAKIKHGDPTNTGEGVEKPGPMSIPGRNVNDHTAHESSRSENYTHREAWGQTLAAMSPQRAQRRQQPASAGAGDNTATSVQQTVLGRARAPDTKAHGRPGAPRPHWPSGTSQPQGTLGTTLAP